MQELRPTWCRGVLSWPALGECCLDAFLFLLGKQLKKSGEKPLLGGSLMEYAILSAIAAMNEPKTCSTTALKKYVLENHPGTNSNYQSKIRSCVHRTGIRAVILWKIPRGLAASVKAWTVGYENEEGTILRVRWDNNFTNFVSYLQKENHNQGLSLIYNVLKIRM